MEEMIIFTTLHAQYSVINWKNIANIVICKFIDIDFDGKIAIFALGNLIANANSN